LFHSDVGGQVITLDSVNAMTGAVSITHTGSADVAIDNGTTALNLGTVGVGQNFTATSMFDLRSLADSSKGIKVTTLTVAETGGVSPSSGLNSAGLSIATPPSPYL